MHIHNVYFWLNPGLSPEDLDTFEKGLNSLVYAEPVSSGSYGKPANTEREVVDNTYDYGLVLFFNDLDAHDAYQNSSLIHQQFIAENSNKWQRVQVYDIDV